MNLSWTFRGVDFTIPGTGGEECANYLSHSQRIIESAFVTIFSGLLVAAGVRKACLPKGPLQDRDTAVKRFLLVAHCLTFGVELGYKLSSRSMIWLLNPCHLTTSIQIVLLMVPASKVATVLFRYHVYLLHGALIALLFPVINTRTLPGETLVYYIQHALIVFIPLYLMRLRGAYQAESTRDLSWLMISMGSMFIYHFVPLQAVSLATRVSVGSMLCPAVSDPFAGRYYRLAALVHQGAAMLVFGKLFTWLGSRLPPVCSAHGSREVSNGHVKQD